MPSHKGCITDTSNAVRLTDKEKLEKTIQDMLKGFNYYTSSMMTVIGKTSNQVITLTIHSRNNYENEFNEDFDCIESNDICLSVNGSDAPSRMLVAMPEELHHDTRQLVMDTADAMAKKLYKAQEKHGYTNGWKVPPDGEETGDGRNFWTREECLQALFQHLEKGDPIDCINYLAFMQANGWRTELPAQSKKREADNKKTSTMKEEINELSAAIARFFHDFDPEEFSPENSGDRAEKMAAELARYLTETERSAT
ncbi:hypothetical protein CCV87_000336 [Salmonella enterica subsp. enterica serovar Sandiego]|nr:hypothetical protein [Salmonella enterica]EDU4452548.1 hypothetical protein [Salmonella enterica subsp. enterica serovar Sandiego]EDV0712967.1 hypothetical protein [Salmonella enterica subsp. enterica]EGS9111552.1 hypothetical protein [Salmonella enterica]EHR4565865.1 hypothetical protein [Salmonella enterica]